MNPKPNISLSTDSHRGKNVVLIKFEYNKELINCVKRIKGTRWSQTKKSWYIEKSDFDLHTLFDALKSLAHIDFSSLKRNHQNDLQPNVPSKNKVEKLEVKLPEAYYDMLDQKRYSDSTKATYTNYFEDYIRHFYGRSLNDISVEEINGYILKLIRDQNMSASQQNQRINSIKFYYEKVLGFDKIKYRIERPKSYSNLPNVLSNLEIKKMVDSTNNLKHKCILSLLYSAGLRRAEVTNLKIVDIISSNMLIKVKNSKGNKDRYVGLSKHLLILLREYFKEYNPKDWLIEGQNGNKYSGTSILKVVKNSAKKAGINRRITPHMLRHSFATHHLELGTDLRYIQEFLGHNSSKTTEIYTHVAKTDISKFKNPFDELYKNNK